MDVNLLRSWVLNTPSFCEWSLGYGTLGGMLNGYGRKPNGKCVSVCVCVCVCLCKAQRHVSVFVSTGCPLCGFQTNPSPPWLPHSPLAHAKESKSVNRCWSCEMLWSAIGHVNHIQNHIGGGGGGGGVCVADRLCVCVHPSVTACEEWASSLFLRTYRWRSEIYHLFGRKVWTSIWNKRHH